ncbi:MAG: thiamine diphosphokinase [Tissierellia bacterium]|nr:thiamine diphosphokinase [Tissierellia bacterium]
MKALVFLGGEIPSPSLIKNYAKGQDFIYCADSGFDPVWSLGIRPHCVIGDMDSISEQGLKEIKKEKIPFLPLNPEKDETDAYITLQRALKDGARTITILGGIGNRQDHQLATFYLLEFLNKRGCKGYIVDDINWITYLEKDTIHCEKEDYKYLSIIPISEEIIVTTKGCYYEISHTKLTRDFPRGISNEWVSDKAQITIEKGKAFIIRTKEKP